MEHVGMQRPIKRRMQRIQAMVLRGRAARYAAIETLGSRIMRPDPNSPFMLGTAPAHIYAYFHRRGKMLVSRRRIKLSWAKRLMIWFMSFFMPKEKIFRTMLLPKSKEIQTKQRRF